MNNFENNLIASIKQKNFLKNYKKIIHIAPHHDDILLSHYSIILNNIKAKHYFVYMTSGYNSVTNDFLKLKLSGILRLNLVFILKKSLNFLLKKYAFFFKKKKFVNLEFLENSIICKKIIKYYNFNSVIKLKEQLIYLLEYLEKNENKIICNETINKINSIKGFIRESEVERMWALSNLQARIFHLNLPFYNSDKSEDFDLSVVILLQLLNKIKPDLVFVLNEKYGFGPKNHIRVFEIFQQAQLQFEIINKLKFEVVHYRNIWSKFNLEESNCNVPVFNSELFLIKNIFNKIFNSQNKYLILYENELLNFVSIAIKFQKENLCELKKNIINFKFCKIVGFIRFQKL